MHLGGFGRNGKWGLAVLALSLVATSCTTTAEHRKLERRVIDLQRSGGAGSAGSRLADQGVQLDKLEAGIQSLQGRLEVLEHRFDTALEEARAARLAVQAGEGSSQALTGQAASQGDEAAPISAEILEYRTAYAKWRAGDAPDCVEHFQKFVKTYPTSDHADDATYWMGDCYFKQGNFSAAVLRFDDVARQYPGGNKAPDALYRQGEALLRMGHGEAASQAFQKVLRDYPDSARVPEAERQLELLGAG
ncbi:MAG: tol-pal system protein YbgF [Myxococcota bacterium]